MSAGKPEKIAILGGGVAGVVAAFELTRPEYRDRYEVTLYQLGWRLGGKGASGRGENQRIEEHGLHIWLGFYDNAFRLMRDCYQELARPAGAPLRTLEDAFKPAPLVDLQDRFGGAWGLWLGRFGGNDRKPGEPDAADAEPITTWWYFTRGVAMLGMIFESLLEVATPAGKAAAAKRAGTAKPSGASTPPMATGGKGGRPTIDTLLELAATTALTAWEFPLQIALGLIAALDADPARHPPGAQSAILRLLETFGSLVRSSVQPLIENDEETRRLWQFLEIVLANLRGVIAHQLLTDPNGLTALDQYDFYEWLRMNGAPEDALDSAFLRGLYDLAFAYENGDPDKPAFAAGIFLRNMLRMFLGYKGAFFYKMQAGMGDTVFAPFYDVLRRRKVAFKFFHRVESLHLDVEHKSIESISLTKQVRLKDETVEYDPIKNVNVKELGCWPSEPDYSQIEDGARLEGEHREGKTLESFWARPAGEAPRTLVKGDQFDRVIFAISLGSVPFICKELVDDKRRWREMVDHVATVQTEALQIWIKPTLKGAGWTQGPVVAGSYVEPFDTWADMSHLIRREDWPPDQKPGSVHYFCNTMPGPARAPDEKQDWFPQTQRDRVREDCLKFLRESVGRWLPRVVRRYPNDFRWELLCAPDGLRGEERLESQFFRANIDPSERYVQSLPGTTQYRLDPGNTGYDNLAVAGDWTDCGLNAGCVEAAVISGMLAARAICPELRGEKIAGYNYERGEDHPYMA